MWYGIERDGDGEVYGRDWSVQIKGKGRVQEGMVWEWKGRSHGEVRGREGRAQIGKGKEMVEKYGMGVTWEEL